MNLGEALRVGIGGEARPLARLEMTLGQGENSFKKRWVLKCHWENLPTERIVVAIEDNDHRTDRFVVIVDEKPEMRRETCKLRRRKNWAQRVPCCSSGILMLMEAMDLRMSCNRWGISRNAERNIRTGGS
jgi:hypothetical protein